MQPLMAKVAPNHRARHCLDVSVVQKQACKRTPRKYAPGIFTSSDKLLHPRTPLFDYIHSGQLLMPELKK